MGRLGNQPVRNRHIVDFETIDSFLCQAVELAEKHEISVETVIKAKHALELERQNIIAVDNGDNTDEQAGGFGELLERIALALETR